MVTGMAELPQLHILHIQQKRVLHISIHIYQVSPGDGESKGK